MSFREGRWERRFEAMGDAAEAAFEEWAEVNKRGFIRYGLNRPPIAVHRLPTRVRYTPDYLTTRAFVECQGFGQDQLVKMKVDKAGCLHWWADLHEVELFLWDSANKRSVLVTLDEFDDALCEPEAALKHFQERKPYFEVPAHIFFGRDDGSTS